MTDGYNKRRATRATTGERHPSSEETADRYMEQVRQYYDSANRAYLEYVGTSFQVALATTGGDAEGGPARNSNLYFAQQAGIRPGGHVLDAGCGVCGPSIDIASAMEGVTIEAITISPVQAATARELVAKAGLGSRIRVYEGDYHELPFEDSTFDVAVFFESSGYSYDPERLFAGVFRVLRPGGRLYIKDVFAHEGPLTEQETHDLAEFNRIYCYSTATISSTMSAISRAGFIDVEERYLGKHDGGPSDPGQLATGRHFYGAMFEYAGGNATLTEFGKLHSYRFRQLPIIFGQIRACKPLAGGRS